MTNTPRSPLISVCIPTFNGSRTIRSAVQSVLDQTYENYEVIIGDDASSDETLQILDDFKDPRIDSYLFDKNSEINDFVNMKEIKQKIYTNNSNQFSKFIFSVLNAKIFIDAFN